MKKVKVSFDTWVQLLGMLGVLGGLVFVGLEMSQSRQMTQRVIRIGLLLVVSSYSYLNDTTNIGYLG